MVDMYKFIVYFCDIYYYQLVNDMGIDNIVCFMGLLGFGQCIGIDFGKDEFVELKGVLFLQEWKKQCFKCVDQQKWYVGEMIFIGIG